MGSPSGNCFAAGDPWPDDGFISRSRPCYWFFWIGLIRIPPCISRRKRSLYRPLRSWNTSPTNVRGPKMPRNDQTWLELGWSVWARTYSMIRAIAAAKYRRMSPVLCSRRAVLEAKYIILPLFVEQPNFGNGNFRYSPKWTTSPGGREYPWRLN